MLQPYQVEGLPAHPCSGTVELLTVPSDLAEYKTAITEALYKGTKRNIESETDPKNAVVE